MLLSRLLRRRFLRDAFFLIYRRLIDVFFLILRAMRCRQMLPPRKEMTQFTFIYC